MFCGVPFMARYQSNTNQKQERKQTMSKTKTKQATAVAAASEPIVVNGIEFTPKMIEDLTKIAELQKTMHNDEQQCKLLKDTYKTFVYDNEAALREDKGIRVGNLLIKVVVSRTLKIDIVD
jgi:hypothetical protein